MVRYRKCTPFAVAVVLIALSACTPRMYLAGHLDDYSEIFTGEGFGGSGSSFQFSGLYSGVACVSDNHRDIAFLQLSENDVACSDGSKGVLENRPFQGMLFWRGTGRLQNGRVMTVYMSTRRQDAEQYLAKFKTVAEARANEPQQAVSTPSAPKPSKQDNPTAKTTVSSAPLGIVFPRGSIRPDDVAVIIGNADYSKGQDIPNVVPAHADAEAFKAYVVTTLGVREGNVIDLRDATSAQLERVFGSDRTHKGQLFDWTRSDRSRVWVYYAGHGAPAGREGTAFLVPADADGSRIEINGYPLSTLYRNLALLPARSVTVVLEACFSGLSQAGSLMPASSGIYVKPKAPEVPVKLTVISAGAADQIASWEKDRSHGLFTKFFLTGMSGEADKNPYGDGDGQVEWGEINAYLKDTLTYYARRYYGRDQTVQIVIGKSQ
jgi:hypothetical protein